MKAIIRIVAAIVIILGIVYVVVLNWPQSNIKSKAADVTIDAAMLYDSFTNDEAMAEANYSGKVIIVSGIIDELYQDENKDPVIVLRSDQGAVVAVVSLEKSEAEKVSVYQEGDDITIKAMCNGMLNEVILGKGMLVE